mgnify:CR=1 FL=1
MNGINVKTELIQTQLHIKSFQSFLRASIEQFRNGEDQDGFENLLKGLNELESAVKIGKNTKSHKANVSQLLAIMRKLYLLIQNQDIPGVIDLLENRCYPLTEEWLKECDDIG